MVTRCMSTVSIHANPNLAILGVKFDRNFTFKDHGRRFVFRISQRIGILWLVKRVSVDISVQLRRYFAFVLPFIEYCSPVWKSAAECHIQVLERHLYSVTGLCPDQSFLLFLVAMLL